MQSVKLVISETTGATSKASDQRRQMQSVKLVISETIGTISNVCD